jgi:hypothetical protein
MPFRVFRVSVVLFARLMTCRGREGDEIEDVLEEEQITTSKPRRRSNSNSHVGNGIVKNKFEVNDIDEEAVEEAAEE